MDPKRRSAGRGALAAQQGRGRGQETLAQGRGSGSGGRGGAREAAGRGGGAVAVASPGRGHAAGSGATSPGGRGGGRGSPLQEAYTAWARAEVACGRSVSPPLAGVASPVRSPPAAASAGRGVSPAIRETEYAVMDPKEVAAFTQIKYIVSVVTSSALDHSGTDSDIFFKMYGLSRSLELTFKNIDWVLFKTGSTEVFQLTGPDLGAVLTHIWVVHPKTAERSAWHLQRVEVYDCSRNIGWVFLCGEWLRTTADRRLSNCERKLLPDIDEPIYLYRRLLPGAPVLIGSSGVVSPTAAPVPVLVPVQPLQAAPPPQAPVLDPYHFDSESEEEEAQAWGQGAGGAAAAAAALDVIAEEVPEKEDGEEAAPVEDAHLQHAAQGDDEGDNVGSGAAAAAAAGQAGLWGLPVGVVFAGQYAPTAAHGAEMLRLLKSYGTPQVADKAPFVQTAFALTSFMDIRVQGGTQGKLNLGGLPTCEYGRAVSVPAYLRVRHLSSGEEGGAISCQLAFRPDKHTLRVSGAELQGLAPGTCPRLWQWEKPASSDRVVVLLYVEAISAEDLEAGGSEAASQGLSEDDAVEDDV